MKRVEHALAVVTTTHPVAVRHVNNNMAAALLPSLSSLSVHRLQERRTPLAALIVRHETSRKTELMELQAGIPQA
ncbi:MAG TPA: hypothetical protein VJS12_07995 [Steroidobacteraceae bacterium]|nr:hypothetical protein [Steroidobacteraceae bacterium]